MTQVKNEKPAEGIEALKRYWKSDLTAGFVVSLIALPLCLGIALASGVPPMSGIIAGIVGGVLLFVFSGSYLTINGPAAGLAVVVLMSIEGFRELAPQGLTAEEVDLFAFQCTLAVGFGCGVVQLLFGVLKAGVLSYFFPSSVVHGMLAAIGIMIFVKQFHVGLGVSPKTNTMVDVIVEMPNSIANLNPKITLITLSSLIILIGWPYFKNKYNSIIPSALLAIVVAVPMGYFLGIEHDHTYSFFGGNEYSVGPSFLVQLPNDISKSIVFPRFDYLLTALGIQMMLTYSLVASLESLLTTAAVDKLDPYKRKSNFNKELFAKGIGNIASSFFGGLPIIAEVVRSSANIKNGAVSRWSNLFHGLFLILFIVVLSKLINKIPLASLAAILMVIGYQLSSPLEFIKMRKVGWNQFAVFVITIIATLIGNLLIGILIGILCTFIIQALNGVKFMLLFKPQVKISQNESNDLYKVEIYEAAVFASLISIQKQLSSIPSGKNIEVDFSNTAYVDDTFLEALDAFKNEYIENGGTIRIINLNTLKPLSNHGYSSRKR